AISVARGEANEDSDIDVLVIWNGDKIKGWDGLMDISLEVYIKYKVLISIKLISPEEYKKMELMNFTFIKNVQKEGVVLG
ncbi:MAG: nucleotidyltransferase family protein, partial [Methanosarcinales archaeon]